MHINNQSATCPMGQKGKKTPYMPYGQNAMGMVKIVTIVGEDTPNRTSSPTAHHGPLTRSLAATFAFRLSILSEAFSYLSASHRCCTECVWCDKSFG